MSCNRTDRTFRHRDMAQPRSWVLAVVALFLTSACATAETPSVERTREEQRYRVTGTVLENNEHGPQLCNSMMESNPPQCEGLDVVGWDWSKVKAESRSGTTWGSYTLIGTYDGERFTLTEPATSPSGRGRPSPDIYSEEIKTPCDEPEGGWRVVDRSKYSMEAQHQLSERVRAEPEFAGMWVDVRVFTVAFAGDLAGREEWIREVWGGPLCVHQAMYTLRELGKIEKALTKRFGDQLLYSNADEYTNRVKLSLYVATDELQDELDAEYGKGVVQLYGWLEPVK